MGMSFLNRFLIEEDTQFECDGIHLLSKNDLWADADSYLSNHIKRLADDRNQNQSGPSILHFIIADYPRRVAPREPLYMLDEVKRDAKVVVNLMVTVISSERLECVQKERYEKFYKEGDNIKYDFKKFSYNFSVYKSVGDDMEDFLHRNKTGILPTYKKATFEESNMKSSLKTFHLSMISDDDEKQMILKKFSNFKLPTTCLKNEQNFALSICFRKTWIASTTKQIWWKIVEPDPWQEKIRENFDEFQAKRARYHEINDFGSDSSYDMEPPSSGTDSE